MITITALIYLACVVVAFKVLKINLSPVTIAVAVLGGVLILGGFVIGWKQAAPISGQIIVHRKVTQLLSNQDSKEFIKEIYVKSDQPVKKGDPLYAVESTPNQAAVDGLQAQFAEAQQKIKQLEAGVEVATAAIEAAKANQAYQKAILDTSLKTMELDPAAVSQLQVEVDQQNFIASQAAVEKAMATKNEANFALLSAQEAVKATEAELATARLNLSQNVIRAPADGRVANFQALEGTMTTTLITSAQGTFLHTSDAVVAAVFPQNQLNNVAADDEVEIAFKSYPGQIATGKVEAVLEYTGEGQFEPSGLLPVAANIRAKGDLVVRIKLDDKQLEKDLPLGGAGTVAIYTKKLQPFHIISKITVRIKMWMYYLPI